MRNVLPLVHTMCLAMFFDLKKCVHHSFSPTLISKDFLLLIQFDPAVSLMIHFVSYRFQAFVGHRATAKAFLTAAPPDLQEMISGPENSDQTVMLIKRNCFSNFICCKFLE